MTIIKLALLGCGDVAQRDYLPELHRLRDRVELVAVSGRGEDRARAVAQEYGIARWYAGYREMLAETEAAAVLNLTPIQLHAETTLAALQAGKHVYSEKPVAGNVAEARRLAVEARARRLKLVCAPSVLLFPQVRYAQGLLAEGVLGPVYSARGYGHGGVPPWHGYGSDPTPFFAVGGGPAVDMGVYPLHAITGLLGPARRVMAMSARANTRFTVPDGPAQGKEIPVEVDDNWQTLLDLGDGRLVSVAANNCVQDSRAPQLEIFGLQGTVALDLLDVSAPVDVLRPGAGWEQAAMPGAGRAAGPDHLLGVEHLIDCIAHDREPTLSIAHALHVVEILEAAIRSAAEGRAIEINSVFTTQG